MLERELIQSRGFRNVVTGGDIAGFQLLLRMPNYRGVWASLIDGVAVRVGDRQWDAEQPLWTLQGRTFTIAELRASTGVRWQLDEPATIFVPHPGGLAPASTTWPWTSPSTPRTSPRSSSPPSSTPSERSR
ncbi:unnamed protein product [[Actinomadura] parvosata subsp. kistnae]|nr:unnamed protein product [Actinomadura parvosata subsp. kistnae]